MTYNKNPKEEEEEEEEDGVTENKRYFRRTKATDLGAVPTIEKTNCTNKAHTGVTQQLSVQEIASSRRSVQE